MALLVLQGVVAVGSIGVADELVVHVSGVCCVSHGAAGVDVLGRVPVVGCGDSLGASSGEGAGVVEDIGVRVVVCVSAGGLLLVGLAGLEKLFTAETTEANRLVMETFA